MFQPLEKVSVNAIDLAFFNGQPQFMWPYCFILMEQCFDLLHVSGLVSSTLLPFHLISLGRTPTSY